MERSEATAAILKAKMAAGLTWAQIAGAVAAHEVWVTSALLGQSSMGAEDAAKAADILGLDQEVATALQQCPMKGSLDPVIPVDPLIYRFYEIMQVYGTTMKAIIHEKCGDGIMSAIDFELDIQKRKNPNGDRVIVTFNGKFLPYRKW